MHTNTPKENAVHYRLYKTSLYIALLALANLSFAESMNRNPDRAVPAAINKYEEFGKHFATARNKKDMRDLSGLFDMTEFAHITARTVFDSKNDIDAFTKGFLTNSKDKLLKQMFVPVFNQNAAVKYLRVLKKPTTYTN